MDRIPHPHSLSTTQDRINERHFLGESFDRIEAERTLDWLAGRFGADSAYAGVRAPPMLAQKECSTRWAEIYADFAHHLKVRLGNTIMESR